MDTGIDWGWWIGIGAVSALTGYLLVAGIVGSWLLTQPARCPDQRTPDAYGWRYEPIEGAISRDGLRLSGWWIPAAGRAEAGAPTVILVHGYADNKSGMLRYARYFHAGCNVVLFDLRACGASQGRRTTQGIEERHDLRAILDWLDRCKAPGRVIAFGVSMGGETALLAAAEDERITALILDSTHDRLRTPVLSAMRTRHLPLGFLAFPVIMATTYLRTGLRLTIGDPLDHVAALGHRPLLILHGSDDDLDPPECAARLAAAAARASVPVQLRFCPGAGHGRTDELAPNAYRAWVQAFMRTVAEPQRAPAAATVASSTPAARASSASPSSASSEVALS